MTEYEKWAAVFEALDKAVAELQGTWPVPRRRSLLARAQHMIGYSRGRGRRPVIAP